MKLSALALIAVLGCASARRNAPQLSVSGTAYQLEKESCLSYSGVLLVAFSLLPNLTSSVDRCFQIKVRDGNFDGLDGLDPTLTWSDSVTSGDIDLAYGIEASATPTSDIASLPRKIWGKASTDVSGWG